MSFTDEEQKFREVNFIQFGNGRTEALKIHFLQLGVKSRHGCLPGLYFWLLEVQVPGLQWVQ